MIYVNGSNVVNIKIASIFIALTTITSQVLGGTTKFSHTMVKKEVKEHSPKF